MARAAAKGLKPVPTLRINDWEDEAGLHAQFAQTGRLQIRNFLAVDNAAALRAAVAKQDWRLVLNENGKHLDIHPLQLRQIPAAKLREIKKAAQRRAKNEFQYLYENVPVYDVLEAGHAVEPRIQSAYEALNSKPFRARLSELSGLPIDFCDMQATRYRAGHFLTTHDDGVAGKNRQLAYVLNLSQRWRASWGGCLEFTDANGAQIETFVPLYNSLSVFKVPQPHEVTQVRPSAKSARLSLTGWFRAR